MDGTRTGNATVFKGNVTAGWFSVVTGVEFWNCCKLIVTGLDELWTWWNLLVDGMAQFWTDWTEGWTLLTANGRAHFWTDWTLLTGDGTVMMNGVTGTKFWISCNGWGMLWTSWFAFNGATKLSSISIIMSDDCLFFSKRSSSDSVKSNS